MNLMNMLRRALLRGLKEGPVQEVSVQVFDSSGRESVERWQDYGFAGNPVDGQGLVIEAGGHTIVLRMDRIDGRPRLAPYDVAVWHKEGHCIQLSQGGKITAKCTDFEVEADTIALKGKNGVVVTTPTLSTSEALTVGTRAEVGESLQVSESEYFGHKHDNVQHGSDQSGGVSR